MTKTNKLLGAPTAKLEPPEVTTEGGRTSSIGPLAVLLVMIVCPVVADQQEESELLWAGEWTGYYRPWNGDRESAQFLVDEFPLGSDTLRITMAIDLAPHNKYTYILYDLEVLPDSVLINYGDDEYARHCKLNPRADGALVGLCHLKSDPENSGPAHIILVPPVDETVSDDMSGDDEAQN